MPEHPCPPCSTSGPTDEVYTQRDCAAFEGFMAARTASQEAAFFLPHLRSGMRVLDAGCGPGSITVGLAQVVYPGEVIGVDLQAAQVEEARALAAERGIGNVRFETADLYGLPFPDRAFDAVFSHGVVMHLREPLRAIAEMRRVLKQGGFVGLRDPYVAAGFVSPATPLIEQFRALLMRVREHNGSHPLIGAQYRVQLREAGSLGPTPPPPSSMLARSRQRAASRRGGRHSWQVLPERRSRKVGWSGQRSTRWRPTSMYGESVPTRSRPLRGARPSAGRTDDPAARFQNTFRRR